MPREAPRRSCSAGDLGDGWHVGRATMRRRRKNVLFGFVMPALSTGVVGFGLGVGALLDVNLVADGVLVFSVSLLAQLHRADGQRAMRRTWSQAA